jgi:phosphate transport system permease protein
VAAAAVALAVMVNLTTGVAGVAGTAVVAALAFLAGQTCWSLAVEGRRHAVDRLATTAVHATFFVALVPLASLLWTVLCKGLSVLSVTFLTTSNRNVLPTQPGGGVYHALIGTLQQVGIATLVGVPLGVLTAVYLVEYGRTPRATAWLSGLISFFVDVMTGVPSVVMGLFVYTALVLTFGMDRSGLAAAVALTLLMLPVVVRSSEEMLRLVPHDLREAAYALGVCRWRTIGRVVLPTALPGIITGSMLAVARIAGETAPLLLTTFVTQSINNDPFSGPQSSLPLYIWDQIARGTDASTDRAWGGALVLILLVMVLYLAARLLALRSGAKR